MAVLKVSRCGIITGERAARAPRRPAGAATGRRVILDAPYSISLGIINTKNSRGRLSDSKTPPILFH